MSELEPEWATLVGKIVIWWGTIEHRLVTDLITLRGLDEIKGTVTGTVPWQAEALIDHWEQCRLAVFADDLDQQKRIADVAAELRTASVKRNHLVHSGWPRSGSIDGVISLQSAKSIRKKADSYSFASHKFTADELKILERRLARLRHIVGISSLSLLITRGAKARTTF